MGSISQFGGDGLLGKRWGLQAGDSFVKSLLRDLDREIFHGANRADIFSAAAPRRCTSEHPQKLQKRRYLGSLGGANRGSKIELAGQLGPRQEQILPVFPSLKSGIWIFFSSAGRDKRARKNPRASQPDAKYICAAGKNVQRNRGGIFSQRCVSRGGGGGSASRPDEKFLRDNPSGASFVGHAGSVGPPWLSLGIEKCKKMSRTVARGATSKRQTDSLRR